MINVHWSTILYVVVISLMVVRYILIKDGDKYGILTTFWLFMFLLFTSIWGGIFWW